METIGELTTRFPHPGKVEWIGLRSGRRQPVVSVETASVLMTGLEGDRRKKAGLRAVTLIQHEHLTAIAALAGKDAIGPAWLRRNIVVSGISLAALKGRDFFLGTALLRGTDICAPCSRMEEVLGPGGYNAMRGHGGICAEVMQDGIAAIGDRVVVA